MKNTPLLSTKTLLGVAGLSAAAALFVHGFLYSEHLDLKLGALTGPMICDINEHFSCSAVAASRYSDLLGIPVAMWGFITNFVYLILLAMWPFVEEDKRPAARRNLLIVAFVILAASIVMGSISLFLIGKGCIFCIAAYVLSVILFACTWTGLRNGPAQNPPVHISDFKSLAILGVIAFIAAFIINDQIERSHHYDEISSAVQGYVSEWLAAPRRSVQTVDPLVTGPAADKAKMTLVEYADFRCPHCQHAHPVLKAFIGSHPDVRLEFQPWPLDGECNSSMPSTNNASCLLARLMWCAEKNGGHGWAAHDYIFEREIYSSVDAIKADIPNLAKACSTEAAALQTCADSEEAKSTVRKMADAGNAMGVHGTPTFFANGRQLTGGQSLPILKAAYDALPK